MDRNLKNLIESPEFQQYHKTQREPPFNVFDVLRNAEYEIRHSNVLAWLLDPGQNHGIGDKFLREFVRHLNEQADKKRLTRISMPSRLEVDEVEVERETLHVDILILFRRARLLLAVENKTVERTGDHYAQVRGYETRLRDEYGGFDIRSILLTASSVGDAHEREVLHVSWTDIHKIVKSLHENNDFGDDGEVQSFVRQYLDVIGRISVGPGAGTDYLKRLLEEHKLVLARLHEQQETDDTSSLQRDIEQNWSNYRETVDRLTRVYGQRPAELRSAVRDYLKRRNLETKMLSREGRFWLSWELSDVAKALDFDSCLVWSLIFSHTDVTLKFYFPGWSNRAPKATVRRRIIDFLKETPIDKSGAPDRYRMNTDNLNYFYVYENRLLDQDELLAKTYNGSLQSIREKLDAVFVHGSDYERIETYLRCLAFSPRETVPHDTDSGPEE